MAEYIAYHSVDIMKRDFTCGPGEACAFYSEKPEKFLRDALGSRAWILVGRRSGRRTRYELAGSYVPRILRDDGDGFQLVGDGVQYGDRPDVTDAEWLRELARQQSNFSFGFNLIRDATIIEELTRVQDATSSTAMSEGGPARTEPLLTERCIYTIVTREVLDRVALERTELSYEERKHWTTGHALWQEAGRSGLALPAILGDAKDCSSLLYWGEFREISLLPNGGTRFRVDRLRALPGRRTPQDLRLVSSGEFIAPGFIRPYAICWTPPFLPNSLGNTELGEPFLMPDEGVAPESFIEGTATTVTVNSFERSPEARRRCIEHHGARCVVCSMDFEERYGDLGTGFIHVHHVRPLRSIGVEYKVDPVEDLVPVCPNCHAMIHRRGPVPLSVEELRSRLRPHSSPGT